jgi:hypothetical protein
MVLGIIILGQSYVLCFNISRRGSPAVRTSCESEVLLGEFGEEHDIIAITQSDAKVLVYSVVSGGYPFTRPWIYSHLGMDYNVVLFIMGDRLKNHSLPVHHGRIIAGLALSKCNRGHQLVYNDMDVKTDVRFIADHAFEGKSRKLLVSWRPATNQLRTSWYAFEAGSAAVEELLALWWRHARDIFLQDQRVLTDLALSGARVRGQIHNVSVDDDVYRFVNESHCPSNAKDTSGRANCVRSRMMNNCALDGRSFNYRRGGYEVTQ